MSDIANAENSREAQTQIDKFWRLYNGPMSLLETNDVKTEMQKFGGLVSAFEGKIKDLSHNNEKPVIIANQSSLADIGKEMRDGANRLSITMRLSLRNSWNSPFERQTEGE